MCAEGRTGWRGTSRVHFLTLVWRCRRALLRLFVVMSLRKTRRWAILAPSPLLFPPPRRRREGGSPHLVPNAIYDMTVECAAVHRVSWPAITLPTAVRQSFAISATRARKSCSDEVDPVDPRTRRTLTDRRFSEPELLDAWPRSSAARAGGPPDSYTADQSLYALSTTAAVPGALGARRLASTHDFISADLVLSSRQSERHTG